MCNLEFPRHPSPPLVQRLATTSLPIWLYSHHTLLRDLPTLTHPRPYPPSTALDGAPGHNMDTSHDQAGGYFSLRSEADTSAPATTSSLPRPDPIQVRKQSRMSRSQAPRPIITPTSPSSLPSTISHTLPSAPASPPTPAPSPTPTQRALDWSTAAEHEDSHIKDIRSLFGDMSRPERLRLLGELLNQCGSHELSFVAEFVSPRLKKDPFMVLPTELCLRVSTLPAVLPLVSNVLCRF